MSWKHSREENAAIYSDYSSFSSFIRIYFELQA